ncbi:adenine phosphoribosyltransferase [Desulforamulus reducens MI-1]|uniref:Adenine phosphoribosyltransferase n=1 Tax=Desulforamulus reducens (strain ATCC BAA-1160 / DSM 100696 / MI-1) TaxID=349161 RepID=APT_DESRM|nr:adenine phosphoribosyltransferase [Desulforamulus reducens]A4J2G8.1 RecName: Full=Adenine phosphoribosyltransferase; Short=APRT [Desulforamulus reducens MI-1]ABO49271.1 adenine phosphoribosyltransferase [Desulforamulus reducens MI-1]
MDFSSKIRLIKDFPKPGINFRDITTLLQDAKAFKQAVDAMVGLCKDFDVDVIACPEARGFVLGAPMAYAMGKGLVLLRKPGKLPGKAVSHSYQLEYGMDSLEVHEGAILPGHKVLLVDDVLATGGTVAAGVELIKKTGGEVVGIAFLIELLGLNARDKLGNYPVVTLLQLDA